MALPAREIVAGTLRSVGGMREVIQDLVTPDLKALKAQGEALAQELRLRNEALSHEIRLRSESMQDALSKEILLRTESLQGELRLRDLNQTTNFQRFEQSHASLTDAIKELARKIDALNLDLRERLASVEARMPRQ